MPDISVVIPTYNDNVRLSLTLWGLCQQTHKAFEVIVVNDGGEDEETRKVINCYSSLDLHYRYLYPKSTNYRPSLARNCGIDHAIGKRVLFIDCDCIPHRRLIDYHRKIDDDLLMAIGLRYYVQESKVDLLYDLLLNNRLSYDAIRDTKLLNDERLRKLDLKSAFLTLSMPSVDTADFSSDDRYAFLCHSHNLSFPIKRLRALNGFDKKYDEIWGGEDTDLAIRFLRSGGRLLALPDAYVYHLNHPKRASTDESKLRAYLQQTRQGKMQI